MRTKKVIVGAIMTFCISLTAFAQDEIWYFGASKDGLDFSGGAPSVIQVPFGKGPSGFYECNASVSDGFGNLLFYTDGLNIYNKNHDVMPNGGGLSGPNEPGQTTGSSSQGVIVVQDPGNADRYYVLYADCIHNNFADGYRYTVVDMTLDGTNGDVVPGLKDLVIMSGVGQANQVGEFLNAVCVAGTTWVLSHRVGSDEFLAHKIDASGINLTPVVSAVGPVIGQSNTGQMRGTMAFSHGGDKLALASGGKGVYIFDFDASNGKVSNPVVVEEAVKFYYGTEWSPDDSKLYFSQYIGSPGLFQYDLATTGIHQYAGGPIGSIRLAPDGKIYGAPGNPARTALSVVNNPDQLAGAANYVQDQQGGFSGGWITLGLPDNFVCIPSDTCDIDPVAAVCDTTSAFQLTANPEGNLWGGGAYITAGGIFDPSIAGGGTHWVTNDGGCVGPDSIQITVNVCCPDLDPNLGNDTMICDDASIMLDAGSGLAQYRWYENGVLLVAQTGSTLVADSGTYVIEVEDINGCTGTDTIEIGNYQLPVVDLGSDTFFCATHDVTVDAGAGFTVYAWSPSGGSGQLATFNSPNTYTVSVTDVNGCQNTDDIIITEEALPTPTITGSSIVCEDSSIVLTANIGLGSSHIWTGGSILNPLTVTAGGTYKLYEMNAFGCVDSAEQTVTLENLPNVDLGGPYTICYTQGSQLLNASTGASGESYLWSDNSTGSTLNITDSSLVSVIVTSANGCIAYDTAVVDTFSLPVVNLGPDTFFCSGLSIDLDAGAGFASYVWSPSGSGQVNTVSSAATYDVIVTDANGCMGYDTVIVDENALPEVDLGSDITICEADSITLDATHPDAASYLWTPNNENTATIKVGSTPETYGVTITDVDGCEFATSRTISQEDLPVVDLGATDTICDDLTKTLDAGAGAGQSYAWYLDGVLIAGETGQTIAADSGTYVVSVTTPLGCETRDTVLIDNYQLPLVDLGGDYEYCELDSVQLDAGNPTASHLWTPGGSTDQMIWVTAGTYTVTVTDTNGCINSDVSIVSENANPVVNLGANDSACVGLEIELDATVSNGVSYVWSNGHNDAEYTLVGPDTLSVIATDANGCIGYDTIQIAALDSLDLSFAGDNQVCQKSESDHPLDAGSFEGATYTWEHPDGTTENGRVIVPYLDGWYKINVTDKYNCKGLDSIFNIVIPVPNISLGDDTSFCSLGKDTYTVKMEFTQNIVGQIAWLNEDSTVISNNNANDSLFTATYAPSKVIGRFIDDATGCIHIDTVELTEYCDPTIIKLPNVFVPGGGTGGNTTFRPIDMTDENFIDLVNNIVWSDFQVYNRWGLKVFQSNDIIPNWDGTFENRPVASGVYYWIYKYKDSSLEEYHENGFVQVIQQRD